MLKEIQLSNNKEKILKTIIAISIPFLTLLLSHNCEKWVYCLSFVLSFILGIVFIKLFVNKIKKIKILYLIISFLISIYFVKIYYDFHYTFQNQFYNLSEINLIIISLVSVVACTFIVYFLIDKLYPIIKRFFKSLNKFEKMYLLVVTIASLVLCTIVFNVTTAFYYSSVTNFDIIYTADSSSIYKNDTFLNVNAEENDIRQPLFGVFSIPFCILAKGLSQIFFMIPNSYIIFLTTIQMALLAISLILISRLFNFKEGGQRNFILIFTCSATFILFSLILEQYIIAFFYLSLLLYSYIKGKSDPNYVYACATGTLLTSGILFPLVSREKNIKAFILKFLKIILLFVIIFVVFGQLPQIFNVIDRITRLMEFTGQELTIMDKFNQFISFFRNVLIAPSASVGTGEYTLYGYYVNEIYTISKIGLGILLICIISVIINRKNKMAKIAGFWILFSFLLIFIIGWGTAENGTNLYSLYFAFAIIGLLYLFMDTIIKNVKLKNIFTIIICTFLVSFNIPELINIINFGIEYYPL